MNLVELVLISMLAKAVHAHLMHGILSWVTMPDVERPSDHLVGKLVRDVAERPSDHLGGKLVFQHRRFKHRSIKTAPPPSALALDSDILVDRITSLQKCTLVGRRYFSKMEDSKTRKWIDKKWKLMLGYMPTVVRFLKG